MMKRHCDKCDRQFSSMVKYVQDGDNQNVEDFDLCFDCFGSFWVWLKEKPE